MTYAILEAESLVKQELANKYMPVKMFEDYFPLNTLANRTCHVYIYALDKADEFMIEISKQLKSGWFAAFWDKEYVYMVMLNRIFKLKNEEVWSSDQYEKMRDYAEQHGIQRVYVDLNIALPYYKALFKGNPEKPLEWA